MEFVSFLAVDTQSSYLTRMCEWEDLDGAIHYQSLTNNSAAFFPTCVNGTDMNYQDEDLIGTSVLLNKRKYFTAEKIFVSHILYLWFLSAKLQIIFQNQYPPDCFLL